MVGFTPWMLMLLVMYWLAHRDDDGRAIADALALNWAVNQAMAMSWQSAGWGGSPLLAFWVIDLVTATWLGLFLGTKLSRKVGWWFIPMLALNTAVWVMGSEPSWHYYALLCLAYLQAATVLTGLWGHGILETFTNTRHRVGDKLAVALSFVRGIR